MSGGKHMSLNKILLIGNLGSDPEIRYTPSGKPVTSFPVATNRRFKSEGEIHQETEWFHVVTFGRLAEVCSEFLKKGKPVFIEGRMHTRSWVDAEGGKHFRTEVIGEAMTMIGKRNGDNGESQSQTAENPDPF